MKTVNELIAHCQSVKNWLYVYGMKGSVMSEEKYFLLRKQYGSNVWLSDRMKIGSVCCDCSGLISSCTGVLRGSQGYYDSATEIKTISDYKANPSKYKGWAVWMKGHIGVADGEGGYYAMDGSARNWVHYPINRNSFTHVLKLKDIDYSNNASSVPQNNNGNVNVYYNVYSGGVWKGDKMNGTVAGIDGENIHCVMAKSSKGRLETRVHVKGGNWLPWVDGYNSSDFNNGYAGDGAKEIDAVQMRFSGVPNVDVFYRVSTSGSTSFLPLVRGTSDYAGIYGKSIDKLQVYMKNVL